MAIPAASPLISGVWRRRAPAGMNLAARQNEVLEGALVAGVLLPSASRFAWLAPTLVACALATGCTSDGHFEILGYTTRPPFDPSIRTVFVPIFGNKTMMRGIEFEITKAIVKEIEWKSPCCCGFSTDNREATDANSRRRHLPAQGSHQHQSARRSPRGELGTWSTGRGDRVEATSAAARSSRFPTASRSATASAIAIRTPRFRRSSSRRRGRTSPSSAATTRRRRPRWSGNWPSRSCI